MDTKKLPVGIENFEEIIKQNFYYVDKTGLIIDLMKNWGKANLFTRPRRFGKSLNMSMLKCFFEVGGDKSIFDGLAVSREKELCEKYMGKYPVISISLKGVDGLSFEVAYAALCEILAREVRRLRFLNDSDKLLADEKAYLSRMLNGNFTDIDIRSSLRKLSTLLEKHYGQKVILLIDEYDVPLDKAYAHGYYAQMIDVIRAMLGDALKTNDSLFFAVLTGCLRVSKESIFTGLNNFKIRSISDVEFDEYFGFTDAEVREMLAAYGAESRYEDMRKWYDGYLFGGQNVYCPWDVINYCDALRSNPNAKPKAYWLHTSGNDMVRKLISDTKNLNTRLEVESLIAGQTITKTLNEQLTHSEIDENTENVWSLLYMTGYLTVTEFPEEGVYHLCIPNHEIQLIFQQQVLSWFSDKTRAEAGKLSELYTAFENGDTETITKYLNKQLMSTISFHDAKESFYHGFLLALLGACDEWGALSNYETGAGRADILVARNDGEFGFVVEIKSVKDKKQLDAACDAALLQIEEKDYAAALRRFGVDAVYAYAIAFCGKKCKVLGKKVECEEE